MLIRTKIVATLGPATSEVDVLMRLIEAGVDVCRLNFSHGTLDEHGKLLRNVRQAAAALAQHVAVLGDLCGPKIRLGEVADEGGTGGMTVNVGDLLVIQRKAIVGARKRVSIGYEHFIDDVKVGDRVLIDDGLLRFLVTDKSADEVVCTTTSGGVIKSHKGVNLPNTPIRVPALTDRDRQCAAWAAENGLDYLALSFVRRPEDVRELSELLKSRSADIPIIAKIEKPEAVRRIDEILAAADGLMVARGDLGVEMDVAQVPIIQKDLVRRCQLAGKPVIVATQMLQSMIDQSSPTRAEVSDVANAIFDGTDAVMLSGETSVGKFPVPTVHMMNHIAEVTENYLTSADTVSPVVHPDGEAFDSAVAHGVWDIVRDMHAKAVVVWSQTGRTAGIYSKYRFPIPVVAISNKAATLRRMAMHYGVVGVEASRPPDLRAILEQTDRIVRDQKLADSGDPIIIVAGQAMGMAVNLGGIVIHRVGQAP